MLTFIMKQKKLFWLHKQILFKKDLCAVLTECVQLMRQLFLTSDEGNKKEKKVLKGPEGAVLLGTGQQLPQQVRQSGVEQWKFGVGKV